MKQLFVLTIAMIISIGAIAQEKPMHKDGKKKQMEAMKVAFITKELNLTPEESQQFWPIYNEKKAELKGLRGDRKGKQTLDEITEAEALNVLNEREQKADAKLAINRKYNQKYLKVLSAKKVLKLQRTEAKFKKELLHKMKQRKGEDKKPRH